MFFFSVGAFQNSCSIFLGFAVEKCFFSKWIVERQVLTMFIAACRSFSQIEFSWTKKKKDYYTQPWRAKLLGNFPPENYRGILPELLCLEWDCWGLSHWLSRLTWIRSFGLTWDASPIRQACAEFDQPWAPAASEPRRSSPKVHGNCLQNCINCCWEAPVPRNNTNWIISFAN